MMLLFSSSTCYVIRSSRVNKEEATQIHPSMNFHELQQTLTLKYEELSTIINNWTSAQKKLGHSTSTSSDYPTHIRNAAHKLSILCKVLKYEWNVDL